jgi:hypothetical protein
MKEIKCENSVTVTTFLPKHQNMTHRSTPDSLQTQTPPDSPRLHFLLPVSPPSELNLNVFLSVPRTSHSYSQAQLTVTDTLGVGLVAGKVDAG